MCCNVKRTLNQHPASHSLSVSGNGKWTTDNILTTLLHVQREQELSSHISTQTSIPRRKQPVCLLEAFSHRDGSIIGQMQVLLITLTLVIYFMHQGGKRGCRSLYQFSLVTREEALFQWHTALARQTANVMCAYVYALSSVQRYVPKCVLSLFYCDIIVTLKPQHYKVFHTNHLEPTQRCMWVCVRRGVSQLRPNNNSQGVSCLESLASAVFL